MNRKLKYAIMTEVDCRYHKTVTLGRLNQKGDKSPKNHWEFFIQHLISCVMLNGSLSLVLIRPRSHATYVNGLAKFEISTRKSYECFIELYSTVNLQSTLCYIRNKDAQSKQFKQITIWHLKNVLLNEILGWYNRDFKHIGFKANA